MVEGDKLGSNHNNGNDSESINIKAVLGEKFVPSSLPDVPDTTYNGIDANSQSLNDHHGKDDIQRASDLLVSVSACAEVHKTKIRDLAFAASEELRLMAQEREPFWILNIENGYEILNLAEYRRRFGSLDPALGVILRVITEGELSDIPNLNQNVECRSDDGCMSSHTTENMDSRGSRAIGVVHKDPSSLVNMLMDVDKWSATFSNIVSKATNLAVLSGGSQDNLNGDIQVMVIEFQIPSPLVKTQEMYLVRYLRQIDTNTWVVADVSLETIFPNPVQTCQRKPSGCIIEALQDGLSLVTWMEHNAECNSVDHCMFYGLLKSGSALSAKRWVSTLERHCDRIATLKAQNDSLNQHLSARIEDLGVARSGLLKLADRMVRRFNSNICSNNMESGWRPLPIPGAEEILVKTSFNLDDPEIPRGVAVTIATSAWLPAKQNDVFNFLRTGHNRNKWDILSHGREIKEVIHISSARNTTDCVSVISVEPCSTRTAITYLQESFNDTTACYLVYAPVDVPAMHHILQGASPASTAILPSGFAVLPDGENTILTIAFEIMDEQLTTPEELPPQSVLTAYGLVKETVSRIRTALLPKI